jgi:integrase
VILSSALQIALADGLVVRNVARAVGKRQRPTNLNEADPKLNCWSLAEAQTFLAAAKHAGAQHAALFHFAIDTGMRRGEICGLRWTDVNLEAATVRVEQQLLNWKTDPPVFGPPKSKSGKRTIDINAETVRLLAAHKSAQASLKMRCRMIYHDLGLVFARDWADTRNLDTLGLPLNPDDLSNRALARIQKAANVRRISFHGCGIRARPCYSALACRFTRSRRGSATPSRV